VPSVHYSSYDRGFDLGRNVGHSEVSPSPVLERGFASRPPNAAPWRKFMALAIVGIMVLTGFAVIGQGVLKSAPAPDVDQPETARPLAGNREVKYTMDLSHMSELYLKQVNGTSMGRWNGTMGLNTWWQPRQTGYGEWQARSSSTDYDNIPGGSSYPYALVYDPYSTRTTPDIDMGNSITTWYRMYVDAKNITEFGTGPGEDPIFTPAFGTQATPGGWCNISWYGTYLERWELTAIRAGTHYANSFYGVPTASTPRATADDGYWHELQGVMTFDRNAAHRILNLPTTGDLRTAFTANETTIEADWFDDWMTEGGGIYDTYTAYDYSNDIRWLELKLDVANSTANNIKVRFWSISWGNEALMIRYLEAANVLRYWQGWNDDWYLNISIGPDQGSVQSRSVVGYHMAATKDSTNTLNGWALEAVHMDWCGNAGPNQGYPSPYNDYDPDQTNVDHVSWAPLTTRYGLPASYIMAPLHWNLTSGEQIVVKLPSASQSLLGYDPERSLSDTLGAAKLAEMAANSNWGEVVMGNGYPNSGPSNLKNFYNPSTKTVTLTGPLNFDKNWNPSFPGLLDTGSPMFVLNVAKVSKYTLSIVGDTPPYDDLLAGTPYTLRVTATNGTGSTITSYNGTCTLTSTDATATFGEVTHHWVVADNGDYETTVQFNALGTFYVNVTDANFTMDGKASITVNVIAWIPEFPTVLVPVMGAALILFVLRAKRRRS